MGVLLLSDKILIKHPQTICICGIPLWPLGHMSLCIRRVTTSMSPLCWHQKTRLSLLKADVKYYPQVPQALKAPDRCSGWQLRRFPYSAFFSKSKASLLAAQQAKKSRCGGKE